MNAKLKTVEDIRHLANTFKGLIALADELEHLGKLEQTIQETEGRTARARAEEADAKEALREARAELGKAQARSKQAVEDCHRTCDNMLAEAGKEAAKTVSDAQAKASDMRKKSAEELSKLTRGIEAAKAQLGTLNDQVKEKQSALDALKSKLAEIRQKLA